MTKFLWIKTAVASIKKAVARMGGVGGLKPPTKTPRQRARQFYERARQAVRYGALSARVVRIYSAFRRKVRIGKLWFTSSTWGGWWFAALLLLVVFGVGAIYLYFIPDKADTLQHLHKADTLQHLQFYAVIVIGLGSLYFAGTSFWAKRGSAFFVEYQTATDINTAEYIPSASLSEEIIGNPANSIMPYVKRIYIRNEKNKHEAIKRILLLLPDKHTLVLKEYEKADALLIKPYEDKVLKLNSATIYGLRHNLFLRNKQIGYHGYELILINAEYFLQKGEIIIETAQGQSYIKNNNSFFMSYDKKKLLAPLSSTFRTSDFNHIVISIRVLSVNEIVMKENFINNRVFYNEFIEESNRQKIFGFKIGEREGTLKIQITLNKNRLASLCYSFQANKKNYTFCVQEKLQKEFSEAYREAHNKNNYNNLNCDDFTDQFKDFCVDWAKKKWDSGQDRIYASCRGISNQFAIAMKRA